MSTPKNPQMAEVLVNKSANRIATNNDLIKHYVVALLKTATDPNYSSDELGVIVGLLQDQIHENEKQGGTNHAAKHVQAVEAKFGVDIRVAYVPTEKFIFA